MVLSLARQHCPALAEPALDCFPLKGHVLLQQWCNSSSRCVQQWDQGLLTGRARKCSTGAAPTWLAHGIWRAMGSSAAPHVPVVIAGAGPSGLTLALWLSRYGVRTVVLDKADAPSTHPQAHFINNRTMEVLRPLQGLAGAVASASPPLAHWRSFRYGFSMTGEQLGEVDHFPGQAEPRQPLHSPEPVTHLPQSRLLPLMVDRAVRPGSLVSLQWGHTVHSFTPSPQGVAVHATDAHGGEHTFQTSFLVAADGVHSRIRRQLGIGLQGKGAMQHLINIHFTSPTLGSRLLGRGNGPALPAMLYFVFNREVVGVIVAHDLERGEFVAQVPFHPPLQSAADFQERHCQHLVTAAAGLPAAQLQDLRIHQVRPWVMTEQVAARFTHPQPGSIQGPPRVFLVGDAAHAFPPAGGFGMNTGIQDAHNLAWKLALAVRQEAAAAARAHAGSPSLVCPAFLLGSYEAERRPVACANAALSVRNWQEAVAVPAQLGLDPRAADVLNTVVTAVPFPAAAGKALLEAGLAVGRGLTSPWNPARPIQLARLRRVLRSGVTLRLQFPREDLGFRYAPGAPGVAVAGHAGCDQTAAHQQAAAKQERDAPYVPSSDPGYRLPHCWLQDVAYSDSQGASAWLSTLDIVAGQGARVVEPAFTLFADGASGAANAWLVALHRLLGREELADVPIVGVHVLAASSKACSTPAPWRVMADAQGRWVEAMQVQTGSALLVRPDGHVAWKHGPLGGDASDDHVEALLRSALAAVLRGGRV